MENSPLRFLDNDVAQWLNKAVRVAIEEKSRQYHIELYQSIYDYTEPYPHRSDIIQSIHVTHKDNELFLCDKISVKNIVNEFEKSLWYMYGF